MSRIVSIKEKEEIGALTLRLADETREGQNAAFGV